MDYQIATLAQELPVAAPTTTQQANSAMWAQIEFDKQVAKSLVRFGLLAADPTEIPVTEL